MEKSLIYSDILKESIYECKLKNGLKVFVIPKEEYSKKYAIYSTNFGSIDSKFKIAGESEYTVVPDGVAHFLEHKMFDMPYGNAMDKLTSLGANANAYTSFDHTSYLFSCTDNFNEAFEVLLDYVQKPYFPEESVENEKGIIGQEIRMYEDNPEYQTFFNLMKVMYKENPIMKDIAGTCETISDITPKILEDCHKTFYHPSNMIICVVGNVNPDEIFDIVWEKQVNKEKVEKIKRLEIKEQKEVVTSYVENKFHVGLPIFMMGFKQDMNIFKEYERDEYLVGMDIILNMLFGKSSMVYKNLYESGLINGYLDIDFELTRDSAYSSISGESQSPDEVKKIILDEIKRVSKEGLDEKVFDRIRKMQLGKLMRSFNSVDVIAQQFVSLYFKQISIFDYVKEYEDITFEEVKEIFKNHFDEKCFAMSVVKS